MCFPEWSLFTIIYCFYQQRVQGTGSDGTDLQEVALETFLCTEEDEAHQEVEIFGKRFVVIIYLFYRFMGFECVYSRLSGHQLSTLVHLRVSSIYHTFTTFVQWAVEGRYDFHMLPYALKTHLNQGDMEQLKMVQSLYKEGEKCCPLCFSSEVKWSTCCCYIFGLSTSDL